MKKFSMVLFVVSLFVVLGSSAYANLIVNGSFEDPILKSGTWTTTPSITILGWTQIVGSIELRNNVAGVAQNGYNFVELDAYSNSSMFQSVDTVAGQKYTLSYYYAPRVNVAEASNGIELYFNDKLIDSVSGDGFKSTAWMERIFTVTGTEALDKITFKAVGTSDSLGGSIDNVSMEKCQVPEPSFLLLAGMGLIGLAGVKVMFGKK